MYCPLCMAPETKVIDSRLLTEGSSVRRRRKCESCHQRFTTYEKIEIQMPAIVKNDGRRENYIRDKVFYGIKKACHKRPISMEKIENIVEEIEKTLIEKNQKEISSVEIGKNAMSKLYVEDPVAYVRFASFYWNYEDVDDFVSSLQQNLNKKNMS